MLLLSLLPSWRSLFAQYLIQSEAWERCKKKKIHLRSYHRRCEMLNNMSKGWALMQRKSCVKKKKSLCAAVKQLWKKNGKETRANQARAVYRYLAVTVFMGLIRHNEVCRQTKWGFSRFFLFSHPLNFFLPLISFPLSLYPSPQLCEESH